MKLVLILIVCTVSACTGMATKYYGRMFPRGFMFGASSAAYQTEGAWNEDGKSESIWDHMTHNKTGAIKDHSNGDVAADSYHNYKRDVEMMRELGLDAYRFSISWPRLLPSGFTNNINPAAVNFYNNYIDEMIKYNITPIVTMYHWDLPQKLQDMGGFINPLFANWFEEYSRMLYILFGDRVKHWVTFNDPKQICYNGYATAEKAPMLNATDFGEYHCAKNLLLAHARAYNAYDVNFKPIQNGECGISLNIVWVDPDTDSDEDRVAAEAIRQADWLMYTDPIFSEFGGFPKELKDLVQRNSLKQGYRKSRLPDFTHKERALVLGSADFFGINYYTGAHVTAKKVEDTNPWAYEDTLYGYFQPNYWKKASPWMALAPNCLYKTLMHIMERYNNPKMYITENGWPTGSGLEDDDRIQYHLDIWDECLDALKQGVNLNGYLTSNLMDSFGWNSGYTERFGMYEVDFSSPARTRTPRKSAFVYKEVIKSRFVDHNYDPETRTMWIDKKH